MAMSSTRPLYRFDIAGCTMANLSRHRPGVRQPPAGRPGSNRRSNAALRRGPVPGRAEERHRPPGARLHPRRRRARSRTTCHRGAGGVSLFGDDHHPGRRPPGASRTAPGGARVEYRLVRNAVARRPPWAGGSGRRLRRPPRAASGGAQRGQAPADRPPDLRRKASPTVQVTYVLGAAPAAGGAVSGDGPPSSNCSRRRADPVLCYESRSARPAPGTISPESTPAGGRAQRPSAGPTGEELNQPRRKEGMP